MITRPLGTRALLRLEAARRVAGLSNALQATDAASRGVIVRALAAATVAVGGAGVVFQRVTASPSAAASLEGIDLGEKAMVVALSVVWVIVVGVDGVRRGMRAPDATRTGIDRYLVGARITRFALAARATLATLAVACVLSLVPLCFLVALPGDYPTATRLGAFALTLGIALVGDAIGGRWRAGGRSWRVVLVAIGVLEIAADLQAILSRIYGIRPGAEAWPRGAMLAGWEAVVAGASPGRALVVGVGMFLAGAALAFWCRWHILVTGESLRRPDVGRVAGQVARAPRQAHSTSRGAALWKREWSRLRAWSATEPLAVVGVVVISGAIAWTVRWMPPSAASALTSPMMVPWFMLYAGAVPALAVTHVLWADESPEFAQWLHALLPDPVLAPMLRASTGALVLAGWVVVVTSILATRATWHDTWHALGFGLAAVVSASAVAAVSGVWACRGAWNATVVGRGVRTVAVVVGLCLPMLASVALPHPAVVTPLACALGTAVCIAGVARWGLSRLLAGAGTPTPAFTAPLAPAPTI